MASVRVRVTHPTVRADGSPGAAAGWQLQTRADANPGYGNLGAENAISVLERVVQNVVPGKWWFRSVWRDAVANGPAVTAEASVDVPLSALVAGTIDVTLVAP